MPIGILINVTCVVLGGLLGSVLGKKLPDDVKTKMNWIFGISSIGMGAASVVLMQNLPAVIFSLIVGSLFGLLVHLGKGIEAGSQKMMRVFLKNADENQKNLMLTAVVLFCASGTGIYGSLDSGMTGNHSILIAKACLDFFSSMVFATNLGKSTSLIAIPQFVVMIILFITAKLIIPLTTPTMINDFKAAGGFILIATGLRMLQLRNLPVADMLPSMVIVMPVSYAWTTWLLPLIS